MVIILFISQGPLGVVLAASITQHFVVFPRPRGRAILQDADCFGKPMCETHSTCENISLVSILLFL